MLMVRNPLEIKGNTAKSGNQKSSCCVATTFLLRIAPFYYSKLQGQPCCGAHTHESLTLWPPATPRHGTARSSVHKHNTLQVLHKTKTIRVGPCLLGFGLGIGLQKGIFIYTGGECPRSHTDSQEVESI